MNVRLSQTQIQKQILAPAMQQSIEILLLPLLDLHTLIEQELQSNPLLEAPEPNAEEQGTENSPGPDEQLQRFLDRTSRTSTPINETNQNEDEQANEQRPLHTIDSLVDHLLKQLYVDLPPGQARLIGELIIGNLDEDGYLNTTLEAISQQAGVTDITTAEDVLKLIQSYEPSGIAARDLKESLLIQLRQKDSATLNLARRIIEESLTELGHKKFTEIARHFKVPIEQIKLAARQIATLDPRPARNYQPLSHNTYIKPDIVISVNESNEYEIQLNNEGIPALRVNSFYRNMLKQQDLDPATKKFIRDRLQNAMIFIKGIEQRGQTIRRIAEYVLEKQKPFFLHGHCALSPMNLKDVAEALSRNESTISRAINNKYIETPQGLLAMKFFFSQGIQQNSATRRPGDPAETISNRSIKEAIKELIANENKTAPLSDNDIQSQLAQQGMKIARRTIAKYRQAAKIFPAHLRKN